MKWVTEAWRRMRAWTRLGSIEQRLDEEPMLTLALLVLYEAFENGRPIESVEQDRARMLRLADQYRSRGGPSLALVETWVNKATSR